MEAIMSTKEIQLSRKITNQILHLAQQSADKEICGLIGSVNGVACSCYAIGNNSDHPQTRFQLDEKQQISAFSTMRDKGEGLFAIYHSHPTAPAVPSITDIKLANYPDTNYLIISLSTKGILEIRGFTIINEIVEEMTLSLIS